jgi:ABC-type multidrug transport system fused ATPase/permease subunit
LFTEGDSRFVPNIGCLHRHLCRRCNHIPRLSFCCTSTRLFLFASHDVCLVFQHFYALLNELITRYYLATSRELKRMDAVSRSPIFAWFSESLNGLSTIRAFSQQSTFVASHRKRVDANQSCYLPAVSVNRWLAVRLEFVGTCIIFIVSLLSLSALVTTGVDAALVGLVLSYALNTTSSLVCLLTYGFSVTDDGCRIGWSDLPVTSSRT